MFSTLGEGFVLFLVPAWLVAKTGGGFGEEMDLRQLGIWQRADLEVSGSYIDIRKDRVGEKVRLSGQSNLK